MFLRTLFLLRTFTSMLVACAAKCKRLSKLTPRIFGYRTVGMVLPSTFTFNIFLNSVVHVVRRETDDLGADIRRFLLRKKSTKSVRKFVISVQISYHLRPKKKRYSHPHMISEIYLVVALRVLKGKYLIR